MLSEREAAQLFERMPFPATVRSLETNEFVAVNRAFEQASGYGRSEVLDRHPIDVGIYPDERDFDSKATQLAQRGKLQGVTMAVRLKSGEIVDVTLSAAVVPVDSRAFTLVVFTEFTPRAAS